MSESIREAKLDDTEREVFSALGLLTDESNRNRVYVNGSGKRNTVSPSVASYLVRKGVARIEDDDRFADGKKTLVVSSMGKALTMLSDLEDKMLGEAAESKFDKLVKQLKKRKDVKDPEALAAYIGRKKYGEKGFAKLSESTPSIIDDLRKEIIKAESRLGLGSGSEIAKLRVRSSAVEEYTEVLQQIQSALMDFEKEVDKYNERIRRIRDEFKHFRLAR